MLLYIVAIYNTQMEKTLPFRLAERLKRDFEMTCAEDDQAASQVLRQLVRAYVDDQFDKRCATVTLRLAQGSGPVNDLRTGALVSPDWPEDLKALKRKYHLLDAFERLHPEVAIMPYAEREEVKRHGHELKARGRAAGDLAAQVEGYERIMRAHFARSAESSLDVSSPFSYLDHPGYDEFARHYVAADLEQRNESTELLRALQARWPSPPGRVRVKGSYWRLQDS